MECLELFTGYLREMVIDVYAKEKEKYANVNYRLGDSFDEIDKQALVERLSILKNLYT